MPAIRAKSNFNGSIGVYNPTNPAHEKNDILLFPVETSDQAVTVSGWTEVLNSPQSNATTVTRLTMFWKRAASNNESNPATSDSGDHQCGQVLSIAGCIETGNPWDVGSAGTTTSVSSQTMTGATTTVPGCLVFICLSSSRNSTATDTQFSAWANADLANITEVTDATNTVGTGGGFGIATGEKGTAGAFGDTTVTVADALGGAYIILALKPSLLPLPEYPRRPGTMLYTRT